MIAEMFFFVMDVLIVALLGMVLVVVTVFMVIKDPQMTSITTFFPKNKSL